MKVSKEFWVSSEHLDKINKYEETFIVLRNKDEYNFSDSIVSKAVNKITITYEVDRKITLNESEARKILKEEIVSHVTVDNIMQKLFGDSNE